MPYSVGVEFMETTIFTDRVTSLLGEESYRGLQNALIARPDLGVRIPGTGGLRKVRWGAEGRGKRSGVRVIYFWAVSDDLFLMLDIYGKGERSDLTPRQARDLKHLVEGWLK